jgi:Na+/H+-dicarboxylate symporter
VGASTIDNTASFDTTTLSSSTSILDIIKRMIPTNPISSLASGDMLGIIFFAIFFGIVLSFTEKKYSATILSLIESIYQVVMKMTQAIITLAPIGVLGLMTKAVSNSGLSIFKELGLYALTIFCGLSIHLFIVLPLILLLIVKVNPIKHFKAMASAMVTAFSTSSSSATLPVTIKCVKDNVKASNEVSSFVLPMGATINMDGTALYECAGVLFIAQALGIPLDASQQFIVVITALLASIGAAGIPSAGLVMLFIVTDAVGLNSDSVAIWVGSMLAIDRPLDMFRTMVNITSDSVGVAVIAKSEGEKLY